MAREEVGDRPPCDDGVEDEDGANGIDAVVAAVYGDGIAPDEADRTGKSAEGGADAM